MTASADRPLAAGTVVANNYRVTKRLGAGGMGTVYLAENITLGGLKAVVKVLRGGQTGAGQEEALLMASLHHPNVVTVLAHDVAFDSIVMEFLDGSTLSTLLEKGIDRINAIRIGIAVADALAAVHRRGLVHRDIKPENVMLALNTGSGRLVDWLKLIDFGLALKEGKAPQVLLGTPEYCGPEQFYLQEPAHSGNDIYALGVTLFLVLTGTYPFDGPPHELPQMHVELPPPSLVERLRSRPRANLDGRTIALLEDLDELIQHMMSKVVSQRPTAMEVARRLTKLENAFSEAGTFVGTAGAAISSDELQPIEKKNTSTSMLTRLPRPKLQPPPSGEATMPATMPTLDAVRAAAENAKKTAISTDELLPIRERPVPLAPTASKTLSTERTVSTDVVETQPGIGPPKKFPLPLVAGLAAVVIALIFAVAITGPKTSEPTPTNDQGLVEPPTTPVEPTPAAKPDEILSATAKPDAPPDELDGLPTLPKGNSPPVTPVKKPEVVKAVPRLPPCRWDRDAFSERYQAAAVLLPDPEAFDAEATSVKAAADCARAEALLQKMKLQAKPR